MRTAVATLVQQPEVASLTYVQHKKSASKAGNKEIFFVLAGQKYQRFVKHLDLWDACVGTSQNSKSSFVRGLTCAQ